MGDLKIGKIPLGEINLIKFNPNKGKHMKVVESLRDKTAVDMCYDVYQDVDALKKDTLMGNPYLVKKNDDFIGYMYISDEFDGERILAYIIDKKLRGKGLGKVMLTSVGDYLFEHCGTSTIKLYINKNNTQGINLALRCGFYRTNITDGILEGYNKNK